MRIQEGGAKRHDGQYRSVGPVHFARAGLLSILLSTVATPVLAQTSSDRSQSDQASNDPSPNVLGDIVVTANRRAENLQDVPVAIAAFTASDLQASGISNNTELFQKVPGLEFSRITNATQIFLRGVGTFGSSAGAEPGVATYVDDVYHASAQGGLFDYNSIDSLEVLKGPQGTLFGRNSTGGVVNIHTKDPRQTPSMDLSVGYGNYGTYSGQAYGNMGLTENLAVNLAAHGSNQTKGWGRNYITGDETFKGWSWGIRGKLLFDVSPSTSILLAANVERSKGQQGMPLRPIEGVVSRNDFRAEIAYPGIGFYDGTSQLDSYLQLKGETFSAKLSHDFGPARLVSITAFNKAVATNSQDVDATPTAFFHVPHLLQSDKAFTQEVQILSPTDAKIQWIAGLFYLNSKATNEGIYTGAPFGNALSTVVSNQRTSSIAVFAQATAEVFSKTNLTAGARYTSDKRRYDSTASWNATTPSIMAGPYNDKNDWSKVTVRLALDHHVTDDLMIYAAYNTGFKSGIYNLTALSPAPAPAPATPFPSTLKAVDPEELTAYTSGFKWTGLDGRLRVNAEGFYYNYRNIQTQIVAGTAIVLINGSSAKIKGFDVTMSAKPINNLTIDGAITVQDGEYGDFKDAPVIVPWGPLAAQIPLPPLCGIPPAPYPVRPTTGSAAASPAVQLACNLRGNKTARTPPFAMSLSGNYRIDADIGRFDLNLSWARGGNFFFDANNNPDTKQRTTNIVNGSVQWTSADDHYWVRLWANNITKQRYFSYAASSTTSYAKYSPASPRTFGVKMGVRM